MIEKIRLGMAELDRVLPGWESHISLDELDLGDGTYCILGQLEPAFFPNEHRTLNGHHDVKNHLGLTAQASHNLGFSLPSVRMDDWDTLTELWVCMILARRAEVYPGAGYDESEVL